MIKGDIDEVRISNIARTQAEAIAAYNSGVGIPYTVDANTISLWHLNEGVGNPVDAAGNNNLTNTNVTWGISSPVTPYTVFTTVASVTTPVIPAGEIVVQEYISVGSIGIKIGNSPATTAAYAGNISASTNLIFLSNNATPYCNDIKVLKNGAVTGHWYWEYGATFTDHSGNGNTATPSFRTTSYSGNVTAQIIYQESLIQESTPEESDWQDWQIMTTPPTEPNSLYVGGGHDFPLGQELEDAATKMDYPTSTFLVIIAFTTSIGLGLLVAKATHIEKKGIRASLLLGSGTIEVGLAVWYLAGNHVIPGWVLIPFGVIAALLLLWRNPTPIAQ
jgi:hypothetical protein